jgi:hypothetical protein
MVDKEVKQEDKIYTKTEHDGIITDLQKERSDRQEAQFNLDQSRRDIESLKKTVEELKNASPVKLASDDIKFEGEEDDYAKVKDVKMGFKNLEKEATATFKKAQIAAKAAAEQEVLKTKFDESCADAITKYSKRASIGLDFQTVYLAAVKRIGRNKYDELAIFHSRNPGEALYKKGSEDPDIKAKLDLEENQELLKNMDTRRVDKDSLVGGGEIKKNDEFFTPQEVSAMKPQEAVKVLDKIEKSRIYWQECRENKK